MQENSRNKIKNPFPGLRPFDFDESHLFFGREGQSQTILQYLSDYKFAAITGASGSGKSSLIYCGVVPLLYGGFISSPRKKWRILSSRPGSKPLWNLAQALVRTENENSSEAADMNKTEYYYSVLGRHSLGLVDAINQLNLSEDENLLVVIDQFEELFRYRETHIGGRVDKDEPESFIRLLVKTAQEKQLPVYIVITMRSDFIGECSGYQELTELINKSNYLVPQMTRGDFEHVITGPLKVTGCTIESRLLHEILNSLENNHDQLPVLQHAMMRTWDFWNKHNSPNTPISLRDYMAAGKIENALSLHANEAYNQLSDKSRQHCRIIFKAITEKGKEGKGIRRPATVFEIAELAQTQPGEIILVLEVFREPGRSFITPSKNTTLTNDTVIDISHESLMRVWDKLIAWVDEEAASSHMYLRLVDTAELYQLGRTGLMRPPDLNLASNWKKTQNPNRAWAKRYHPAFEKAMVFLNTSEKKLQIEEEIKIKIQRRELFRTRRIAVVMGFFAVGFLGLTFYAYTLRQEALKDKKTAEGYAKLFEMQKDTAVEASQIKEYQRLLAIHERDSLEKANLLQFVQQEAQTEQVNLLVEEATKRTTELEQTTQQIHQEKILAEQQAKLAQEGLSKAEIDKAVELRKRLLTLAQAIALKSIQSDDSQLSGLLATQAYLMNRENGGQINHPDIYRSLYNSLIKLNGDKFNTLKGHAGSVNTILFDPARNILYSTDNSGTINKWTFRKENPIPSVLISNEDANTCLAITIDGRWLACGSEDRTVQLINALQPTQAPRIFDAHDGAVNKVCFIPGRNAMVTSGSDNKVKFWDLLVNESRLVLQDASGINDIDVSPSGQTVVCVSGNGRVTEWNVSANKSQVIYSHNAPIMAITFDFEGEKIVLGDRNGKIIIISASTHKLLKTINAHTARVLDLKFSPDNRLLASSGLDGVSRIWNANNWDDLPIELKEQESWVESLAFSPDGRNLLTTSNNDNLIYVWPVKIQYIADEICTFLNRQLSTQEWNSYIGNDIPYREVCK